jgi:histidinol dehydrogenase
MPVNYLKKAKPVLEADVKALRHAVEEIIDTVRKDGDAALARYAKNFDDFEGPMRVGERSCRRRLSKALILQSSV